MKIIEMKWEEAHFATISLTNRRSKLKHRLNQFLLSLLSYILLWTIFKSPWSWLFIPLVVLCSFILWNSVFSTKYQEIWHFRLRTPGIIWTWRHLMILKTIFRLLLAIILNIGCHITSEKISIFSEQNMKINPTIFCIHKSIQKQHYYFKGNNLNFKKTAFFTFKLSFTILYIFHIPSWKWEYMF